jgi:hypothetical protein
MTSCDERATYLWAGEREKKHGLLFRSEKLSRNIANIGVFDIHSLDTLPFSHSTCFTEGGFSQIRNYSFNPSKRKIRDSHKENLCSVGEIA